MRITLKYFGMVAESTGKDNEELIIDENMALDELQYLIEKKYSALDKIAYEIAINQSIENEKIHLKENDEIALLPPFAGG